MRTARLFQDGESQAVRLPKEFRFRGDKVLIKKMGNAVVLLPCEDSWQPLIESLDMFPEDFMEHRDQPEAEQREDAFEIHGRSIGALDTLIAAHALSLNVSLVTNNVREFSRVAGLRIEDWMGQECHTP